MRELNVVVWGLGSHAIRNILPALKISRGINLYGVCSRNAEVVSRCAFEQACLGWTDSEKMLEDSMVDVVYLSTPIGLHASQGLSVLRTNKHLWCEKPLAENIEKVSELVALSLVRGKSLAEGFMYLYHPQFSQVVEILSSGTLGEIRNITCQFGIPPLERPGFRLIPELGGGAFLDVGCYPVSAAASFFPGLTPEVLFSKIDTVCGSPVDYEGRAILRYRNGATATLDWGINHAYRNEIDIWGSRGSVSTERFFSKTADYIPQFRFHDLNGRETCKVGQCGNHFVAMFEAFRQLVDDPVKAEYERGVIMRRAQLMDEIAKNSHGA